MLELIGQDELRTQLERSLELGRFAHATLVSGTPGVGKTKLALELAQALNCESKNVPCGKCGQCVRIANSKHADVRTIGDPGKAVRIDDMREMQRDAALVPFEGRNHVFIIPGAERMTGEAANCLLKTLEEPPANVYLILLTAALPSILPTVRSRCRLLDIRPVSTKLIENVLTNKHAVEPSLANSISRFAEGRIGWAINAASNPEVLKERHDRLDSVLELAGLDYSDRLVRAGEIANQYAKDRNGVLDWLLVVRQWWRDVLLQKSGRCDIAVNADRTDTMESFADNCSLEKLSVAVRDTNATIEHLGKNVNTRLALDVLMLRLPQIPTKAHTTPAASQRG